MKFIFLIAFVIALLTSCDKKEVGPQCPSCENDTSITNSDAVIIGNEGNFGWGNASISVYQPATKEVTLQKFTNQNGIPLGDVFQSFYGYNDKLYAVINNSGKILELDTSNLALVREFTGLTSPRYVTALDDKLYCSDLYEDSISVINLITGEVENKTYSGGWTESLEIINNELYAIRADTNWVLKYSLPSLTILDTLEVGNETNSMQVDKDENLWVLCSGINQVEMPSLYFISNGTVSNVFTFSNATDSPSRLRINGSRDMLFFINSGIFSMDVTINALPTSPLLSVPNITYYGLGINPNNSDIYFSDAKDYVQQGTVYRYDSLGVFIDEFNTGIIPQGFWFR